MWLRINCQKFVLVHKEESLLDLVGLERELALAERELLHLLVDKVAEKLADVGGAQNFFAPESLCGSLINGLLPVERDEFFLVNGEGW